MRKGPLDPFAYSAKRSRLQKIPEYETWGKAMRSIPTRANDDIRAFDSMTASQRAKYRADEITHAQANKLPIKNVGGGGKAVPDEMEHGCYFSQLF